MLRRGFLGSLAALFGCGSVAVASSTEPVRIKQRSRFVQIHSTVNNLIFINLDLVQSVNVVATDESLISVSFASGNHWQIPTEKNRHLLELFEQGLA